MNRSQVEAPSIPPRETPRLYGRQDACRYNRLVFRKEHPKRGGRRMEKYDFLVTACGICYRLLKINPIHNRT